MNLSDFVNSFLSACKEGSRIYFAPLIGAYKAIKAEIHNTDGNPPPNNRV